MRRRSVALTGCLFVPFVLAAACGGFSGGDPSPNPSPDAGDASPALEASLGPDALGQPTDAATKCDKLHFESTFDAVDAERPAEHGWLVINTAKVQREAGIVDDLGGSISVGTHADAQSRVLAVKGEDNNRPDGHAVLAFRNFPSGVDCVRVSMKVRVGRIKRPAGAGGNITAVKLAPFGSSDGVSLSLDNVQSDKVTIRTDHADAGVPIGQHPFPFQTWVDVVLMASRSQGGWKYAYEVDAPGFSEKGEGVALSDVPFVGEPRLSIGSVTQTQTGTDIFFDDVQLRYSVP